MTHTDILTYFTAEKNESLVFIIVGFLSVIIAFYGMLSIKTEVYRGLFYPLLVIGLIEVIVGGTVYLRTPKDIDRVTEQFNTAPEKIRSEEIPRMAKVITNFEIYRYMEIALACIGIVCCFSFNRGSFWFGLGLGLAIQTIILLGADYLAEQRAEVYKDQLDNFIQSRFT